MISTAMPEEGLGIGKITLQGSIKISMTHDIFISHVDSPDPTQECQGHSDFKAATLHQNRDYNFECSSCMGSGEYHPHSRRIEIIVDKSTSGETCASDLLSLHVLCTKFPPTSRLIIFIFILIFNRHCHVRVTHYTTSPPY